MSPIEQVIISKGGFGHIMDNERGPWSINITFERGWFHADQARDQVCFVSHRPHHGRRACSVKYKCNSWMELFQSWWGPFSRLCAERKEACNPYIPRKEVILWVSSAWPRVASAVSRPTSRSRARRVASDWNPWWCQLGVAASAARLSKSLPTGISRKAIRMVYL